MELNMNVLMARPNMEVDSQKPVQLNLSNNAFITKDSCINANFNIDAMSDSELIYYTQNNYSYLLSKIVIEKDPSFLNLATNKRFLRILSKVLADIKLSRDDTRNCNKLAYSYLTYHRGEARDKEIERLYYRLSEVVNVVHVPVLRTLGLDYDLANMVAISADSHINGIINVMRVNNALITSENSRLSGNTITLIYERLFTSMSEIFIGIMSDIYTPEDLMSEESNEIYGALTLTALDILMKAPNDNFLYQVLYNYVNYCMTNNIYVRFRIGTISDDYIRIINVFEKLIVDLGISCNL